MSGPPLLGLRAEWMVQLNRAAGAAGFGEHGSIPEEMSFIDWCERLAGHGLKVDGHPWSLANRPALRPLYEAIPTRIGEAHRRTLVLRKGSQLGATLWECLADLYMAIKFEPCVVGLYLPDQATAADKSQRRFLRIIRTIPEAYRRLTTRVLANDQVMHIGEGNVLTRIFGESAFLFLWTSSKTATESRPCDVLSLDELQHMTLEEIDRVAERMSASRIRFRLMLSTANAPDSDIDFWYKQGTQHAFHTECPHCLALTDLSARWPDICQYRDREWTYVCPECDGLIREPQRGRYIAANPDATIESWHLSQIQSPTIDAREMAETWQRSVTGDQKKQWFNRKLGLPYIDSEQLPVTMAHCLACVEAGRALGLLWQVSGQDTLMGIDQMGGFNAVVIKRRLPDNRQAVVHVEAIFDADPFRRCDELMAQYGVSICCVEQLPNVNDARAFCNRHRGRAYLVGYSPLANADMIVWGDQITRSDRKTAEDDRSRYTVNIQQYKAMQATLFRVKNTHCLFPDPALLVQDVLEKGVWRRMPLVTDWVFSHYTKTALVVDMDEETRSPRPRVVKVGGIDPHYSFASMLCDVAWARVHGASMMILPEQPKGERAKPEMPMARRVDQQMPGLPRRVLDMMDEGDREGTCARCISFERSNNLCSLRQLNVAPTMVSCPLYDPLPRP